MKTRISFVVGMGAFVLLVLGLGTNLFLMYELNEALNESGDVMRTTSDVRSSTRKLVADYLRQGDAVSTLLLDLSMDAQFARKLSSDSAARRNLETAIAATEREDLKVILKQLASYDRRLTDSLENYILELARINPEQARDVYLNEYRALRRNNIRMVNQALFLAESEVMGKLHQLRADGDDAQSYAWIAIILFGGFGGIFGFVVVRSVGAIAHGMQESSRMNQLMTDQAHDVICSLDREGRFVRLSPACHRIWGYTEEELLGVPGERIIHPDDLRSTRQIFEETALKQGRSDYENRCLHKDGRTSAMLWAISWSEQERLFFCVAHEITERKRAEESRAFLAAIVESSNDAIIGRSLDGTILSWNPGAERMFGYLAAEMIGQPSFVLLPPERQEEFPEMREKIEAGHRIDQYETQRVHKDGSLVDVSIMVSSIRDSAGTITGISTIMRDMREEQRLRRQLDAARQRRTDEIHYFALGIQQAQEDERRRIARELHDGFGQRLTGISMSLEASAMEIPESNGAFHENAARMKKQIDLLIGEIRRLSANLRPLALDDFGLVTALKLLCQEMEKTHNVKIEFHAEKLSDERIAPESEIALFRIAQEALTNVAKYAGVETASVTLAERRDENHHHHLLLTIQDAGAGFDPGELPMRRSSEAPGGFGIISMKERVELLGGIFRCDAAPGCGTEISVSIPMTSTRHDEEY